MIHNATILRIDTPAASTVTGTQAWTEGDAVAIRCNVQGISKSQQWQVDRLKFDATAVVYIKYSDMPAGVSIANGQRALVQVDGLAATTLYEVRRDSDVVKRELSHVMAWLRAR